MSKLMSRSGDGARAKELSNQGKAHAAKQDQLDDQASEWIWVGTSPFFLRSIALLLTTNRRPVRRRGPTASRIQHASAPICRQCGHYEFC